MGTSRRENTDLITRFHNHLISIIQTKLIQAKNFKVKKLPKKIPHGWTGFWQWY